MAGRLVKTLPAPDASSGIGTTLIWDGTDNAGAVAPGGAYVYRIKGEGKTFTGTVAVAGARAPRPKSSKDALTVGVTTN